MAAHKKKEGQFQEIIEELADAVVENLKEEPREKEPFDIYVQQMRIKVHCEMDRHNKRCSDGYKILIEELSKRPLG